MSTQTSSVVTDSKPRRTVINLKQVTDTPLRNVLESFDNDGDGKIDIAELQRILYWYGLWKYASIGLCIFVMVLIWSSFGLTIWAINLTKEYSVSNGVLTSEKNVIKTSVASLNIPLGYASLLDRRHLDALDSLTLNVDQPVGNFSFGIYHLKIAGYSHFNATFLKLFGHDGSEIWIDMGRVIFYHHGIQDSAYICGSAICNTLAVDTDNSKFKSNLVDKATILFSGDYVNRDAMGVRRIINADKNGKCTTPGSN